VVDPNIGLGLLDVDKWKLDGLFGWFVTGVVVDLKQTGVGIKEEVVLVGVLADGGVDALRPGHVMGTEDAHALLLALGSTMVSKGTEGFA
jgi:hypothetical protein